MVQRLGEFVLPILVSCSAPIGLGVTGGVRPIGRLTGYTATVGLHQPLCPAGHCFTSGAKVCSAELANLKANPLGKWKSPPLYGVKSISMWESAPLVLWFSIEGGVSTSMEWLSPRLPPCVVGAAAMVTILLSEAAINHEAPAAGITLSILC